MTTRTTASKAKRAKNDDGECTKCAQLVQDLEHRLLVKTNTAASQLQNEKDYVKTMQDLRGENESLQFRFEASIRHNDQLKAEVELLTANKEKHAQECMKLDCEYVGRIKELQDTEAVLRTTLAHLSKSKYSRAALSDYLKHMRTDDGYRKIALSKYMTYKRMDGYGKDSQNDDQYLMNVLTGVCKNDDLEVLKLLQSSGCPSLHHGGEAGNYIMQELSRYHPKKVADHLKSGYGYEVVAHLRNPNLSKDGAVIAV
jgi:hypothetical protein